MKIIRTPKEYGLDICASIWDMDGTVFDTKKDNYKWLQFAYKKYTSSSAPFPELTPEFMAYYNEVYTKDSLAGIYTKIIKTDWAKNEKAIWIDFNKFNQQAAEPIIVDDISMASIISEIYERGQMSDARTFRHRLAINTTKSYKAIKNSLIKNKIHNCFDCRTTYDDILVYLADGVLKKELVEVTNLEEVRKLIPSSAIKFLEKPNSLSSMLTYSKLAVQPHEVIVMEDTVPGILAYKNVMMPKKSITGYVGACLWGFEDDADKLIDAGADVLFEHPSEVIPFYESLGIFR